MLGPSILLGPACAVARVDLRNLRRRQGHQVLAGGDSRPKAVQAMCSDALTLQERERLRAVDNQPRFAEGLPARNTPMLAEESVYLDREYSPTRVLRAQGQTAHRGRAMAPKAAHIDTAPMQVWCQDMAYLSAQVLGR
jgi:putative transposase